MGFNINTLRMLLRIRQSGVELGKVLTIGRQGLAVNSACLRTLLRGVVDDRDTVQAITDSRWAEPLLRALGATSIDSLDASSFENATIIHDLNTPVPVSLHRRFDTVIDGGSLEHVFDVRQAVMNVMQMTRRSGNLLCHNPADSFFGHGLYQFSPEFYFRVFCKENGFRLNEVFIHEGRETSTWRRVPDPATVRRRLWRRGATPTMALAWATCIEEATPFSTMVPQQSDYEVAWQGPGESAGGKKGLLSGIKGLLPPRVRRVIVSIIRSHDPAMVPVKYDPRSEHR